MSALQTFGNVFVAIAAIFAAVIAQKWNYKENFIYNISVFVGPYIFLSPLSVVNKPIEFQQESWRKVTEHLENGANEGSIKQRGKTFYDASYGPKATRLVNFTIPSSNESDHMIPITCSAPYNATVGDNLPLVFYFFGGGLIVGSIEVELWTSRWLSDQTNSVVCAIGYRKSPQHPYPVPINDSTDGSLAILNGKMDLPDLLSVGIDYGRIGTFGTSAGGYMAGQVTRRLAKLGYMLKCQVSICPMAKANGGTMSMLKNWNDVWSGLHNEYAWSVYLPDDDGTLASNWKVSLVVEPPNEVVANLPPTFIEIHSLDPLRDEGEMYAKQLKRQGKLIELREYNVSHIGADPILAKGGSADGALEYAGEILRKHLYQ